MGNSKFKVKRPVRYSLIDLLRIPVVPIYIYMNKHTYANNTCRLSPIPTHTREHTCIHRNILQYTHTTPGPSFDSSCFSGKEKHKKRPRRDVAHANWRAVRQTLVASTLPQPPCEKRFFKESPKMRCFSLLECSHCNQPGENDLWPDATSIRSQINEHLYTHIYLAFRKCI